MHCAAKQHVGNNGFVLQFWMFSFMARVLVGTDVPPGPAIEPTFLHMGNVVRNQIISERVPLVYGAPQLTGFRIKGEATSSVANSVGIDPHVCTGWTELEDVSAILFRESYRGRRH